MTSNNNNLAQSRRIVVIGAGVIGSTIAARLAESGDDVLLLAADAQGGTAASRASFAWVNAHGKEPEGYRRLNEDGRARHVDLADAGRAPWFARTSSEIEGIIHPDDGYADAGAYVAAQIAELRAAGGAIIQGERAADLASIRRRHGPIDLIVVAAGVETAALLNSDRLRSPRLASSVGPDGFLVRIAVDDHPITRIVSIAGLQVRPDGPSRVAAQSLRIEAALRRDGATASVESVWPMLRDEIRVRLDWSVPQAAAVTLDHAPRPLSDDTLPVVGFLAEDVYVALSHSGVTLAPLLGELVARDVHGDPDPRLAPYRP